MKNLEPKFFLPLSLVPYFLVEHWATLRMSSSMQIKSYATIKSVEVNGGLAGCNLWKEAPAQR